MKTLKELIETMTEEEKDIHKNLIEECVQRDIEITNAGKETIENINRISDVIIEMVSNVNIINQESQKIRETVLTNTLNTLPDDQFFS